MKKVLAIVIALIAGLLVNASICALGVFLWSIAFACYLILGLLPMFAYAAFLDFLAEKPIIKHALLPKTFFLWAQAPSVVIALVRLIINIHEYGNVDIPRMFPSLSILGDSLYQNVVVIMFVTVALTTASVFVTAHFQRKESRQ